jgi:hypothetical protein
MSDIPPKGSGCPQKASDAPVALRPASFEIEVGKRTHSTRPGTVQNSKRSYSGTRSKLPTDIGH